MKRSAPRWCQISENDGQHVIVPFGAWRLHNLSAIAAELSELTSTQLQSLGKRVVPVVSGASLTALDTAGALILLKLVRQLGGGEDLQCYRDFKSEHTNILKLVATHPSTPLTEPKRSGGVIRFLERVGEGASHALKVAIELLSFIGETAYELLRTVSRPGLFRVKELFVQLELVCLDAIPIVALVTLLIGEVVAYLFAGQAERYGANIFVVEGLVISMCRELSPIIVAIVVAGRSGSAFTAQIGTMKLNEEIDAIYTLGLSPTRVLVFPRFFALVFAMPLLVFVGDVVGIIGGMIVADVKLGVTPATFISRLQDVIPVRHLWVGLIKAPVFAAFIAIIGCRMGLTVENNALSVGTHTTSTVVQSIVSVILLNAAFAVIFVELGI